MSKVVLQIILSKTYKNAGNIITTVNILIIAPLAIKVHNEPIISNLEYAPTPNVAPKKQSPLTNIELIDVPSANSIASFLFFPFILSFLYFVVINIA